MFGNSNFNGNISNWNVGNVTDMYGMFEYSKFNGNISYWDVSNVKNMGFMFTGSNISDNYDNQPNFKYETKYTNKFF